MSYTVDFKSVSRVGLESSPFADALAGLRANEARYFKNKYDHDFTVEPAGEAEAELLCSVLRGAGIECLPRLTNSGAGAGDGLALGAHDIMVSPRDAQDAREILHEPQ